MRKLWESIRLYLRFVAAILKSTMQYRMSFFLTLIGRFLVEFGSFLGIYFIFTGFRQIKGYSYGEVLMCFSVIQMSFALAECAAGGFITFAGMIRQGGFDRILLRPRSPILQVLGSRFTLDRIGTLGNAVIVLVLGIRHSDLIWTPEKVGTLVLMIAGGVILFSGLFMIGAAVCFFSVEESGCMNVLTYGGREHGKYPIDIYGRGMMRFCTYVVPYTLMQYYPLQFLLGKSDNGLYAFYPFGTIVFWLGCYAVWRFGMRHYASCGS